MANPPNTVPAPTAASLSVPVFAVPSMSTPSMSDPVTSHPPKMRDKRKARAMQVAVAEMSISALSADPAHVSRGQKRRASEDVIVDSSSEEDEDNDKESSGEEEVTPMKSDLSATSSMPRVHVELPLLPKGKGRCKSNAPPFIAMGTVSHWHIYMLSYADNTLRIGVGHVL